MIVPNAVDTVGAAYDVLDQAEPDSIDFELLGQAGKNYVVSGGAVTSNGSAVNINVAASTVVINGAVYGVAASATLALPTAPVDKRFDLVVARLSGGSASLVVIQGANSATNPTYPKSKTVLNGTAFNGALHYDPDNDVILAAVYRPGSGVVTTARIVDKRVYTKPIVANQGVGAPTPGTATLGALYKNSVAPSGTSSGFYIGNADGSWTELASNSTGSTGPYVPIGAAVGWPSTAAVPTGYLEASGGTQVIATYPTLAALYGTTYGGNGTTTFGMPNYNELSIRGTTATVKLGTTTGADTITPTVGQLPSHDHTMQAHTHTYSHSHGIDHDHPAGTTGFVSNDHTHTYSFTTSGQSVSHNHHSYAASGQYLVVTNGGSFGFQSTPGSEIVYREEGMLNASNDHTHSASGGTSGISANHNHSFDVANFSGSTVSQSASTTSGPSSLNVSSTGSGTPINIVPATAYMRWIIRAL